MKRRTFLGAATAALAATQLARPAYAASSTAGHYTVVATFGAPMPTGVTVSHKGRIFVNYPALGRPGHVHRRRAEGRQGRRLPRRRVNRVDKADAGRDARVGAERRRRPGRPAVDPRHRQHRVRPGLPGGAKLVGVDLHDRHGVQTIPFPPEVALKTTYLNDVRFDLRRGKAGVAYITDSRAGPNGIIVVDLDSGALLAAAERPPVHEGRTRTSCRSSRASPSWSAPRAASRTPYELGSDGIAISDDGKHLYYCPLSSRQLYRVPTDALADPHATDADVAATVENLGFKPMADGLESDDKGRLYGGDLEHNAIWRRNPDGTYRTLAQGTDLNWIDTLSVASDRHLYATANQLDRLAPFHEGQDLRRKPYLLVRLAIDAGPVRLV